MLLVIVGVGEGLVRGGREQQHLRGGVLEEGVGEFTRFAALGVQKVLEALELVEDDEVGLQGVDAGLAERVTQLRDGVLHSVPDLRRDALEAAHLVTELLEALQLA